MKSMHVVFNHEFIKNMPDDLVDELIKIKEPIPKYIRATIMTYRYSNINSASFDVIGDNEELMDAERDERSKNYNMGPTESLNYSIQLVIDFVKRHTQFRTMIKEIVVEDV